MTTTPTQIRIDSDIKKVSSDSICPALSTCFFISVFSAADSLLAQKYLITASIPQMQWKKPAVYLEIQCSCTVKKQATENNRQTASTTLFRTKDQKISILRKSKLLDFPTMPTTAESLPLLIYFFLYTLNLYLVKCRQHHGSAFGWTIPTKHRSRQQKPF